MLAGLAWGVVAAAQQLMSQLGVVPSDVVQDVDALNSLSEVRRGKLWVVVVELWQDMGCGRLRHSKRLQTHDLIL